MGHALRRPARGTQPGGNTQGAGEAAGGIAIGTQSSALRGFLAHTRAEESSADRSAADYLNRAGISPRDVFLRLKTGLNGTPMPAVYGSDEELWKHLLAATA